MIAVGQRGALRGVRIVVYDSVTDYLRRAMSQANAATASGPLLKTRPLKIVGWRLQVAMRQCSIAACPLPFH
jgi:hypothetical protein